jgi:hypothetical protein
MNLKQFKQTIDEIIDDIGGNGIDTIGSHNIPPSINFYVDDDDCFDCDYELIEIETDRLGGCGCASGITFRLKRIVNE